MGHGESQIGYLANYINLYGGHALACDDTTVVKRKLVRRVSDRRDELIDRKGSHKKVSGQTHRITNGDRVIGNEPRVNEEFTGWVNLNTSPVNVAYMRYPCGWDDPATGWSSMTTALSSAVHLP
jgi:hypothetical protein